MHLDVPLDFTYFPFPFRAFTRITKNIVNSLFLERPVVNWPLWFGHFFQDSQIIKLNKFLRSALVCIMTKMFMFLLISNIFRFLSEPSRPYMYFSEQGDVDDDATLITIFFGFIQFTVLLPHAVCSLQSAVCSLQMSYTAFNLR